MVEGQNRNLGGQKPAARSPEARGWVQRARNHKPEAHVQSPGPLPSLNPESLGTRPEARGFAAMQSTVDAATWRLAWWLAGCVADGHLACGPCACAASRAGQCFCVLIVMSSVSPQQAPPPELLAQIACPLAKIKSGRSDLRTGTVRHNCNTTNSKSAFCGGDSNSSSS